MISMKFNSSTILTILATLILAAGAYWYFFTGTGNQQPLTATGSNTNEAQARFQTLIGELQSISFDTTIFSDPRFNALVDLTTPVSPEPTGRPDPFAPIPGISGK